MANKIVSLLLQVKNAISPSVKEASADLSELEYRSRSLERELKKLDNAEAAVKGLEATRDAARDAEAAFDQAQLEVERLKGALKSEKTPELAVALVKARDSAADAKKEWRDASKSVTQLERAIESAGGDLNDLEGTQRELATQIDRTSGALKKNKQDLDAARGSLESTAQSSERVGASFGTMVKRAAALVGIVAVVDKVRDGLRSLAANVWETGNQFEQFSQRLSAQEFGYIEEFTRNVPQGLAEVADAFVSLRTFGIDPMNGSMQALFDKNAQMGGSMETLNGIVLAVGQAWSKQKLQQEEALQLIERGIPVWDLLAQAMGKTVPELQKMSTAGELGRKEIQLLIDAMGGSALGAAQKQMSSVAGVVSSLQDRFTQFYKQIADAGVWEYLRTQMIQLRQYIDELAASGKLKQLAQSISDGFIAAANAVKSLAQTIFDLRGIITLLAQAWASLKIANWAIQLRSTAASFLDIGTAATVARNSVSALGTAVKGIIGAAVIQGVYGLAQAYRAVRTETERLDEVQRYLEANKHSFLLRDISEATGVLVTRMHDLEMAMADGKIVFDEATGQYYSAAQAAEKFGKSQGDLGKTTGWFGLRLDKLTNSLSTVREALSDAAKDHRKLGGAIEDLARTAMKEGVEGIAAFAQALAEAEKAGDLTTEQIDTHLNEALGNLSAEEAQRFAGMLGFAMDMVKEGVGGAIVSVENLQKAADRLNTARVEAAFKRLGISQEELTGKITAGVQQSVKDLQVLSDEIKKQGPVSEQTGEIVKNALIKALADVKTEADRTALEEAFNKFRNAGQLSYAQTVEVQNALKAVSEAAKEVEATAPSALEKVGKAAEEVGEAADKAAEKTEDGGKRIVSAAKGLAGAFNLARAEVQALGAEAERMFIRLTGASGYATIDDMASSVDELRQALDAARAAFAFDFATRYIQRIEAARIQTVLAYTQQREAWEKYMDALKDGENLSYSVVNAARAASNRMGLLGDEDLSQLRSALDDAQQKLDAISDSAKSTLSSLQDELDRLQGNQDAIQQRDYENKRAELNAAIDDARRMGNNEAVKSYADALKVLEQVRREQKKQMVQEQSSARSSERNSPASNSPVLSGKTTTINLSAGSGSVSLVGSDADVGKLLDVLTDAGLRAS